VFVYVIISIELFSTVDLHEGQGQVQGLGERDRLEDQEDGRNEGVSNLGRDRAFAGTNKAKAKLKISKCKHDRVASLAQLK
jgi:hypothetical protein